MGERNVKSKKRAANRKVAVALQYEAGDRAPKVLASGAGELAKKILLLAQENKVPIHHNQSLAEVLSQVAVGVEIPPETYKVVAEILAFLYRTDAEWRKRKVAAVTANSLASAKSALTE